MCTCLFSPIGSGKLSTSPPWEDITSLLMRCLNKVTELLVGVVRPVSGYSAMSCRVDAPKPIPPAVSLSPHTASFKGRLSTVQTQGRDSTFTALSTGTLSAPVTDAESVRRTQQESRGGPSHDCSPLERENFKLLLLHW